MVRQHCADRVPHGITPWKQGKSSPYRGCAGLQRVRDPLRGPCMVRGRLSRVAGIFVRFYTLRHIVCLFNAVQRKLADFSTGCCLFYRP